MSSARNLTSDLGISPFEAVMAIPDSAFEVLPGGACVFLRDGTVARFNRHAAELCGHALTLGNRQTARRPISSLFEVMKDLSSGEEASMLELLRSGRPICNGEAIISRPDGSRIVAAFNIAPLNDGGGRVEAALCCFHEVTARKKAEDDLRARVETDSVRRMEEQLALYNFTHALQHVSSLAEICEAALDAIYGALRCDGAAILLFDNEDVMRFVVSRDLSEGYRRAVEGHSPWTPSSANVQPIFVKDIDETADPVWLKQTILKEGIRALAFIPLIARSKVIGKFMAYYKRPHEFAPGETGVASAIGRQVGFAIERSHAEDARRKAEAELRREQELLQSVLDRIPVMITVCEAGEQRPRVNPEFERVTGWSNAASAEFLLMEALYPDPEYRQRVTDFMESSRDGWIDTNIRTRDGHVVETSWANIRLSDGSQVGIGIDITDRKVAERELQRREQTERSRVAELKAIMEAVPAAIWISRDAECLAVTGNRASQELLGFSQPSNAAGVPAGKQLSNVTFLAKGHVLSPDDLPIQRATRGEEVRDTEVEVIRTDGESRVLLGNASPMRDASGRPSGAVAAFVDITERKRAEEARDALVADSLRLAAIVESSDDAIVSKDLNGIIVSWNNGAQRLFGYAPDEVVGKPITILMPPERVNEEPGILARIRRGERVDHFETVRRRKDGKLLDISLTISPVKDGSGRVIGASKIARDITEKKRTEQQRDLMVAELSHRVKNTLATVISIARQSFAHPDATEARSSFDARIRALAQTHSRLAESNWSGVPLQTLLLDELAPYRRGDTANIRLSGPAVLLNARAALSLGMAIHELATNAAKYGALSSRTGVVEVAWSEDPANRQLPLNWIESGGPAVSPPSRSGFGRLLLERALASDLGGNVNIKFVPTGLQCVISLPLQEIVSATP